MDANTTTNHKRVTQDRTEMAASSYLALFMVLWSSPLWLEESMRKWEVPRWHVGHWVWQHLLLSLSCPHHQLPPRCHPPMVSLSFTPSPHAPPFINTLSLTPPILPPTSIPPSVLLGCWAFLCSGSAQVSLLLNLSSALQSNAMLQCSKIMLFLAYMSCNLEVFFLD